MDGDLMLIIDSLGREDRGEIDFLLKSSEFSDEEKNLIIGDIINSLLPISSESINS